MTRWNWQLLLAALLLLLTTAQGLDFPAFRRKLKQPALAPAPAPDASPFRALAPAWALVRAVWGWLEQNWGRLSFVAVVGGWFIPAFFADYDIRVLRRTLSSPDFAALKDVPKVEEPIMFRQDLNQSFHDITDKLKQSVLVWGEHKAGKSTFVQETVKREIRRGRPVLYAEAKNKQTYEELLARLFRWSETAHPVRQWFGIPTSTEMPDIDPLKLTHLHNPHGLPLLVIDNIHHLSTESISRLLLLAKEFVDKRVGVFVFVLSSGAKGREFISFSAMSRVEKMYVGDLTELEAQSFLKKVGRTEEEARKIIELVGARWEYLVKARDSFSDFNTFREKMFADIEGKVLKVSQKGWKKYETLGCLYLFLEGSGQVEFDVLSDFADGSAAAVERMLTANLIQYRLDNSRYELHSKLVKSFLLEKRKERGGWGWGFW